ncbi:MAG TPA: ABC transporter permease/substrate-binding protein [Gammaproteobacteria bacterium]|nr:ABC transporter permease/substrate-binding protein [Gammaproteobacteria bacterium]
MTETLAQQLALLPEYLSRHLLLSVTAIVSGIALSAPLTFAAIRVQRLRGPLLAITSAIQTIPGLALLALMVPLLSRIGFLPALIALILYSVLPILRNAVTGIEDVDANLVEAGRGLGMTENQLLLRVRLPLAMPVVVAGIRTSAVWVVGMATLSTPVGATSLGNYIFSGLQTQNYTAVLVGCIAAATLALALDRLIHSVEMALARRRRGAVIATTVLIFALIGASLAPIVVSRAPSDGRSTAVIGTKTFTEQYILGALIAERLEAAGVRTRTLESLGSTVAFDALAAGRIDAYVDYTGTIWSNYMREQSNPGREAIMSGVRQWLADEHDISIAARLGFENAYAIAVTAETAQQFGLQTIGDLTPVAGGLRFGSDYEFFGRPEWTELASRYGLEFAELVSMDSTLMYAAVDTGEVDVITAFSTDGRIPAFDLQLLADPLEALPPYDAVLLTSPSLRDRKPAVYRVLTGLDESVDQSVMQAANRLVDVEGGTVAAAARMLAQRMAED